MLSQALLYLSNPKLKVLKTCLMYEFNGGFLELPDDEVDHYAERDAVAVDDRQTDQVDPVVLIGAGRREARARNEHARTCEAFGRAAVVDFLGAGDHHTGLLTRLRDAQLRRQCGTARALRGQQEPAFGREERLRITGMGQHLEGALDAPGTNDAADFNRVGWKLRQIARHSG